MIKLRILYHFISVLIKIGLIYSSLVTRYFICFIIEHLKYSNNTDMDSYARTVKLPIHIQIRYLDQILFGKSCATLTLLNKKVTELPI